MKLGVVAGATNTIAFGIAIRFYILKLSKACFYFVEIAKLSNLTTCMHKWILMK